MKQIYIYSSFLISLVFLGLVYAKYKCCIGFSPTTENIIIGLYTSLLTVIFIELLKVINLIRTFNWLKGKKWLEFGPTEEFGSSYTFSDPTATAEIYYLEKNLLSIKLTEKDDKVWDGIITMQIDNKFRGQIAWKYPDLNPDKRFGLKEVIITSDDKYDYIYLMSLNLGMAHGIKENALNPPYGNMILRRDKN